MVNVLTALTGQKMFTFSCLIAMAGMHQEIRFLFDPVQMTSAFNYMVQTYASKHTLFQVKVAKSLLIHAMIKPTKSGFTPKMVSLSHYII